MPYLRIVSRTAGRRPRIRRRHTCPAHPTRRTRELRSAWAEQFALRRRPDPESIRGRERVDRPRLRRWWPVATWSHESHAGPFVLSGPVVVAVCVVMLAVAFFLSHA